MTEFDKTDDRRYIKDKRSTAILNIDTEGYKRFKMERAAALEQRSLVKEVDSLKGELSEIKGLLQQLINGKLNG